MMSEKRFEFYSDEYLVGVLDTVTGKTFNSLGIVDKLNEQQATIDMQELRLQQLEELLELSENLNKSYREKLIDMNLKILRGGNDD